MSHGGNLSVHEVKVSYHWDRDVQTSRLSETAGKERRCESFRKGRLSPTDILTLALVVTHEFTTNPDEK